MNALFGMVRADKHTDFPLDSRDIGVARPSPHYSQRPAVSAW